MGSDRAAIGRGCPVFWEQPVENTGFSLPQTRGTMIALSLISGVRAQYGTALSQALLR